ncbi:MAG: glycosyltransferase family 4 protein [Anaerolineae bacterium]|nr:glycosyltransferase family 4 protein [Anaerolineae bacterium]
MRIAINAWFVDRPTTGSGQYLTHLLAEYAAQEEGATYLLCGHVGQDPPAWLRDRQPRFTWRTLRTPFDRFNRHLAKTWFEQVSFPRACRRWAADLIHVPYWAPPYCAPAPVLVTVHDLIPWLLPAYGGGALGRWYTRLVAASARRAACVLTDSAFSRRDIVHHLGIPGDRVRAVYLAADSSYAPVTSPAVLGEIAAKHRLPARYVLYLGGFDVRKNVPGILRAFALLPEDGPRLVVAGRLPAADTAFTPDPRRVARELGVEGRVCFTGWVDEADKPALYSGALAFLFPSYYEGFGLPPLEALACGTPAIVSDTGSLPEIVDGGGLSVNPADAQALADAIARLDADPALRARLAETGMAHAATFSWRETARQTWRAYRAVLAQRGSGPATSSR